MEVHPTDLPGVYRLETKPHGDARGLFARLYCPDTLAQHQITFASTQINLSTNPVPHTLRGLHFQKPPHAEAKLVRVIQGRVRDVVVDLREGPTFGHWIAEDLSAESFRALLLPEGVAHGFLTLEPDTHVLYQMGRAHVPGHADGLRWNDPDLAIDWPAVPAVMSDKDATWPDFASRSDLG